MSANDNKTARERVDDLLSPPLVDGPSAAPYLRRITIALERIADSLASRAPSSDANTKVDHGLLDTAGVAAHFGVSTRWVQRHVRPSFRAAGRGKKWYRLEDVEQRLAAHAPVDVARPTRPSKKRVGDASDMRRTQPEAEIAEVERRLRASVTKPRRQR